MVSSFSLFPLTFKPFQYNFNYQQSSVITFCEVVSGLIDEIAYSPLSAEFWTF